MSKAEDVLFFDAIFSTLIALFGAGSGAVSLAAFNNLVPPALSPQPIVGGASLNPLAGITQATAYIGWAIVNLPIIAVFMLNLLFLFGNVALGTAFAPQFQTNGIPLFGIFFSAIQLYVVWGVVTQVLRGTGAGV